MNPASKKIGLYSIERRLLRIDLIQIWKAFHIDINVGLSEIFEYARNTRTRGHVYKLSIPLCRKDVNSGVYRFSQNGGPYLLKNLLSGWGGWGSVGEG